VKRATRATEFPQFWRNGVLSESGIDPDTWVAESVRLYSLGKYAAAEGACRSALAIDMHHIAAQSMLGAVLLAQERFGESELIFSGLVDRVPGEPSYWMNLGTARRGLLRFDEALSAYARAADLGSADANFYYNVGLAHLDRADFKSAVVVLDIARGLAPQDPEIRLRYAQACYRALRTDDALTALADWRSLLPIAPQTLAQIGQLLVNLGDQKEGAAALDAALSDPTADSAVMVTGVETFERINRIDAARTLIGRLESQPRTASVAADLLVVRAKLAQRTGDHETALRLYGQSLQATTDPTQRYRKLFPLAHSLDALGRFQEAWTTLREAHASQLEALRRADPSIALTGTPPMHITQFGCKADDVSQWRDNPPRVEDSPVFVVAFPRSGTTLLEIALDAHPLLQSMDEQPFIQDALQEISALSVDYPAALAGLTKSQLSDLRARYWRRASAKVALQSGMRLVDKNPLNILRLPVIRRLFPNSPILLCLRHPCDVMLSCFMQVFRAPDFALLCNSLPSIARGYERTMDFWVRQAEILKPDVHELKYESLVTNFESELRQIMAFLGLPWDDRVLRPGDHAREKGYISTPSYSQVVQPVSNKSVGRWRNYEFAFNPLLPMLQVPLERWGYAAVVAVDGVSPNNK